jgi:hypothetical protein
VETVLQVYSTVVVVVVVTAVIYYVVVGRYVTVADDNVV